MTLGQISALIVWGATAAYTIALIAFSVDLARLADAGASRRRVPVAAGVGDVLVDERPDAGPGPQAGTDAATAARSPGTARRIAMAVTVLGFAFHAIAIVTRGVAAGRVPWANMYEFTLVGTFAAVATFLVLVRVRGMVFLGTFVIGVCALFLGVGQRAFYVPAVGVEPILQSPWLVIHVSIATIATGLFTVAFATSALQLLKDSRVSRLVARPAEGQAATAGAVSTDVPTTTGLAGPRWRLLDGLPPVRELEAVSFRVNAVAFVLWTFTLISGSLWAEVAWGAYWQWDPKEVWTFVVWVIYAAYLHARTTRGWAGRRAAWFVIVGYAAVIFNYTVVNLLIPGNHSYSGI